MLLASPFPLRPPTVLPPPHLSHMHMPSHPPLQITLQLDLSIVVDTSGSIDQSEFTKMQEFLLDLVDVLTISATDTQVQLISFDAVTRHWLQFRHGQSTATVKNNIRAMISGVRGARSACGINTPKIPPPQNSRHHRNKSTLRWCASWRKVSVRVPDATRKIFN